MSQGVSLYPYFACYNTTSDLLAVVCRLILFRVTGSSLLLKCQDNILSQRFLATSQGLMGTNT